MDPQFSGARSVNFMEVVASMASFPIGMSYVTTRMRYERERKREERRGIHRGCVGATEGRSEERKYELQH